jgi:predicted RNA binding protein YcfA (HicA-like mRNA interferase family)
MSRADTQVRRELKAAGFEMERYGKGGHQLWRHRQTGATITVPSSGTDMGLTLVRSRIRRILRGLPG